MSKDSTGMPPTEVAMLRGWADTPVEVTIGRRNSGIGPAFDAEKLREIVRLKRGRFSWEFDPFAPEVSDDDRDALFGTMAACAMMYRGKEDDHDDEPVPSHTFLVLTDHPKVMREYLSTIPARRIVWAKWAVTYAGGENPDPLHDYIALQRDLPLDNVWLGVYAQDQKSWDANVRELLYTPAYCRVVDVNPQIERINPIAHLTQHRVGHANDSYYPDGYESGGWVLHSSRDSHWRRTDRIHWVRTRGHMGREVPHPFDVQWARDIVRDCRDTGTAVFVGSVGANTIDSGYATFVDGEGNVLGSTVTYSVAEVRRGHIPHWLADQKSRPADLRKDGVGHKFGRDPSDWRDWPLRYDCGLRGLRVRQIPTFDESGYVGPRAVKAGV